MTDNYATAIKKQTERIMSRMKITSLETGITNIDDVVFKDNEKPLTLRRLMMNALATGVASDQNAKAKDKEHCYDLMLAVKTANGELELEAEDAAIIKDRIAQLYQPIIVGQAVKLIEGKSLQQPAAA
jgi:hypothetical protein